VAGSQRVADYSSLANALDLAASATPIRQIEA
jgi:hypothetical protein